MSERTKEGGQGHTDGRPPTGSGHSYSFEHRFAGPVIEKCGLGSLMRMSTKKHQLIEFGVTFRAEPSSRVTGEEDPFLVPSVPVLFAMPVYIPP